MCGRYCLSFRLASAQLGRYGLEEKDFDFSAGRVTAGVHESLERLGLEYLDVVQAHDVEFGSLDQVLCSRVVRVELHRGKGRCEIVGLAPGHFHQRCGVVEVHVVQAHVVMLGFLDGKGL